MITVFKYPFAIIDEQTLMLPSGFQITLVGLDPCGVPCIWAEVDTECGAVPVRIRIVGTGQEILLDAGRHVGSFVQSHFVWHVFLG